MVSAGLPQMGASELIQIREKFCFKKPNTSGLSFPRDALGRAM